MDNCEVSVALQAINDHVTHCNGYLERHKPWEMKKDESKLSRVGEILSHTAESCAQLAVLLRPILPDAAAKIFGQLNKGQSNGAHARRPQMGALGSRAPNGQTKAGLP